jgi:putative transcriptional regulator
MERPRSTGADVIQALEQALAFARGEHGAAARVTTVQVPDEIDVRAIRRHAGLSQRDFAARYGFALSALRDWEQGRRRPERSARILLKVIEREPEAVERAVRG